MNKLNLGFVWNIRWQEGVTDCETKINTTTPAVGWLILTAALLGPVGVFLDSRHSVALWLEGDQMLLPWFIPMLAGGFTRGLIWIGFNKTLLNRFLIRTRRLGSWVN